MVKKSRRWRNKVYAILYLGGRCVECGEIYHPSQYDVHHVDGRDEETPRDIMQLSRERLVDELDKCELLCANCHRLEHTEESDDWI